MVSDLADRASVYKVVVNQEGQFSIWPKGSENPGGWRDEGTSGNKEECLSHIAGAWKDMRPQSLRNDEIHSTTE